jgi:Xaa-Pro aminopeptidase
MNPDPDAHLPLVIHADPGHVPDLYYLTGLMAPDPYLTIAFPDELVVAVSPLEYGRALRESRATRIVDTASLSQACRPWIEKGHGADAAQILVMLAQAQVRAIRVLRDFPFHLARSLMQEGIELHLYPGALLRERLVKRADEIEAIREAIGVSQSCLERVRGILTESVIVEGKLTWDGDWLSSERLRHELELLCLARGYDACNPILACGDQACDPHEKGSGVIAAHQLLIADVFPRSRKHGYWGDLTRTFLKGAANDAQRRLVASVAAAQKLAIGALRAGVESGEPHRLVEEYFCNEGYESGLIEGVYQGFFHGTGHGFGLAIHEPPRLGKSGSVPLLEGMVVTVEPGLYYPGIGGCRIEDDLLVTAQGAELLSCVGGDWIIP